MNPRCHSLQVWWLLRDGEMVVLMADGPFGFLAMIGFAGAVCLTCFANC